MSDRIGLLIIGGGPAGLSAARAYRERRRDGEIAIVADEQRMPYARPPLTKELLRGEIGFDQLPGHEAGAFTAWYGAAGRIVGVLTHNADDDYARGAELIAEGARWSW